MTLGFIKKLSFPVLLMAVVSCGSYDDDTATGMSEESPGCPEFNSFETRLSSQLSFSGVKCEGEERADEYICDKGHWLITIDNLNSCTNEGICTKILVSPVVAELNESSVGRSPEYGCTYQMRPLSPVSVEQSELMLRYEVHVLPGHLPEVLPK